MPINKSHLSAAHRRNLRWSVIKLAKEAGRYGLSEDVVLDAVVRSGLAVTGPEVREAAHYVEKKGFVEIDEGQNQWVITITSQGIDLVEYDPDVKCPSSIGRPPNYWD